MADPIRRPHGLARPSPGACGYTIIELLVVIAIIGILASMLMGGVMVVRRRGAAAKVKALILRLDVAIKQYESDFGDYPHGAGGVGSAETLYACLTSSAWRGETEFNDEEVADTDGNGSREIVDHWGQPISYYHHRTYSGPPCSASFRLISPGPDGEEGTDDDVNNFR